MSKIQLPDEEEDIDLMMEDALDAEAEALYEESIKERRRKKQ